MHAEARGPRRGTTALALPNMLRERKEVAPPVFGARRRNRFGLSLQGSVTSRLIANRHDPESDGDLISAIHTTPVRVKGLRDWSQSALRMECGVPAPPINPQHNPIHF